MIVLLCNVIKGQFNNNLSELLIGFASFNSLGVPNDIIHLSRFTLLIIIFSYSTKTQWDTDSCIRSPKLFTIPLRNGFLFKSINQVMMSHVNEHLLTILILSLYYKACLWLNHSTTLFINDGVPIGICESLLVVL